MKLTFKKHKRETGLRAVGNPYPNTDIKLKGGVVGLIDAPNWQSKDNKWKIRFCIKREPTPGHSCPFEWTTLAAKFDTEDAAREFIKSNEAKILEQFDLHALEP